MSYEVSQYRNDHTKASGRNPITLYGMALLCFAVALYSAWQACSPGVDDSASWRPSTLHAAESTHTSFPLTQQILKPIEEIQEGDRVVSRDPDTGEIAPKPVETVFHRVTHHLRILDIESESSNETQRIETTNEHPFWVTGKGWVNAGDLKPGDQFEDSDGGFATLAGTTEVPHPEGVTVYNVKVADWHTYHVKAQRARGPPIFVHNADCPVTLSDNGMVQVWSLSNGKRDSVLVRAFRPDELEREVHRAANRGELVLSDIRDGLETRGLSKQFQIRESASELPILVPGSREWDRAARQIRNSSGHGNDFHVATLQDAMHLLHASKGVAGYSNAIKGRYDLEDYLKAFQQHNIEIDGNTPWHTLPHLKWIDGKSDGHIYFGTVK